MILKNNVAEAARSLYSAKQRTLLALIGIVIGIGSVIAMVTVGKIVQEESIRQFKDMGTDLLTIEKEYSGGGKPAKNGSGIMKLKDIMAIPASCPGIAIVAPTFNAPGSGTVYGGKKIQSAALVGVTESALVINKLRMLQGRFLSDLDEQSRYCVLGYGVYNEIVKLGGREVIGGTIRNGEAILTIIGVLAPVPEGGMRRFNANESVFIPITTAMRMSPETEITAINARVTPGVANNAARSQVRTYFSSRKLGVRVTSPEEIIAQMEKQMQMFTLLLGAIGSISLIVGGVGVMNVMLVSVTERRREIGIRRALGAKRGDIKGQFLIESIILSLIGGFFGIVFGVGAARIIAHLAHWQFMLSLSAILLGVGVSTGVGIFFGYYPARQASLLDPIVALRSD